MKRATALVMTCLLALLALPPGPAWAAAPAEYASLAPGAQGQEVTALQQRLAELGLTASKADGIYGKQTTAAVAEAQRLLLAAGYQVPSDGLADAATQALLFDPSAEDALTTLRSGSKGDRVKQLQARLIDLKLLNDKADGAYGSATRAAVLAFQQQMIALGAQGIAADGVANGATQALLNEDLSAYGFVAPIYFDASKPRSLTPEYLYAKGAVLIDAPTGQILFEVNADARLYPASTTKLMTLLLAVEQADLDAVVTIPASAADVPEDSSLVPVYEGEQMRMLDLLYGLMIRSGNDAANAVAELLAGSVDRFVQRMNERAAQLGMSGTRFVNPHGYHDPNHYSTARDLATLARQGLTNQTFREVVTCLSYTLPPTSRRDSLSLSNSYEIFDAASPYYIAGAAGVKSGYTSAAGFCYVGAAQRDGRTLIAVVLGCPSRNRAWLDLSKLFEFGFAQ